MQNEKSRLSVFKQVKLIELFVAGVTARKAAEITGVNRNTARTYFTKLRQFIFEETKEYSKEVFTGEIELDESFAISLGSP